jgi:hypothetical protein
MYRLDYDPDRRLVTATLEGFWTPDTVAAYSRELFALLERVDAPGQFTRLLARGAAMSVQSPETSAAFGAFTFELVDRCVGPIAITVGSTLNKIQASRVLAHARIRVFVDEAKAMDWLMAFTTGEVGQNHQNSESGFA